MNEQLNFSKRLQTAMINAGYEAKASVLEREFNLRYWGKSVTLQAVRRWLKGEAVPTQDRLKTLSEWLDIDPHWLRFGERLNGSLQEQRKRWDSDMSLEERTIVETFMSLPAEKRKIIGEVIRALAKP